MDSRMSTTRIMAESSSPPTRPAIAPQRAPIVMAIRAAKKPTSSEAWPPFMSSPRTSKPSLSVPSGCPVPGDRFVDDRSVLRMLP